MFSCVVGREEHYKQISLACVGSACSVWTTLGLPQLMAAFVSWSTVLRLQVALQGHCPKRAMCFLYSPGLNHSRSLVLRKGTNSVGCAFCVLLRSEQLRQPGAWRAHCPRWTVHLNHLPGPSHSVSQVCHKSTISDVLCISSVS